VEIIGEKSPKTGKGELDVFGIRHGTTAGMGSVSSTVGVIIVTKIKYRRVSGRGGKSERDNCGKSWGEENGGNGFKIRLCLKKGRFLFWGVAVR